MKNTLYIFIFLAAVYMVTSCKDKSLDEQKEAVKSVLSECVQSGLDDGVNVMAGMACLSRVGETEEPISFLYAWRSDKERYEDCSHHAERMPVPPSGIMQVATLAYYLDRGLINVEDSVTTNHGVLPELENTADYNPFNPHVLDYERETGRGKMTIRDGLLKSIAYVTDRYVLDHMDPYGYDNDFAEYVDRLTDYFGPSAAYFLPHYRYQGIMKKAALSIADGSGVLLSPWQILSFYGSIANDGTNPRRNYTMKKRICSEETAQTIQTLLRDIVLEGTGALVRDCAVPVAGKTGNGVVDKGRIPGYGSLEEEGALKASTFVGYFPADAPKYTMCITFYYRDGYYYSLAQRTFKAIVNELSEEGLL